MIGELFRNDHSKIRKVNLRFNKVTNDGAWRLIGRAFEKNRLANDKSSAVTKMQKINLYNNKGIRLSKMISQAWKYI